MLQCKYKLKNNKVCCNKAISVNGITYDRCHIKSHWTDISQFNAIKERLKENFISSTLDIDAINIINTRGDGACLYRTMAKYFLDNKDLLKKYNFIDVNVLDHEDTDQERYVASKIQDELNNYIYDNKSKFINQCGELLEDIVMNTHNNTISCIEEYHELYKIFAGDNDYYYETKILDNGKKKKDKIEISDRWGSTAEQIAFSLCFGIEINVYIIQKFDERKVKIIEVTKRAKNIRLKLYQKIDPEIEGTSSINKKPLNIIIEKHLTSPHYMYINNLE